jgi:hypothetical protein
MGAAKHRTGLLDACTITLVCGAVYPRLMACMRDGGQQVRCRVEGPLNFVLDEKEVRNDKGCRGIHAWDQS